MPDWRAVIRDTARPVIGPVWRRIWGRIEARLTPIEARLTPIEARLAKLEEHPGTGQQSSWERLVPSFLNAVSTVQAFGHGLGEAKTNIAEIRQQLAAICQRIEVLQAETTSEPMRAAGTCTAGSVQGAGPAGPARGGLAAPRILAIDKLAQMRAAPGGIRLNIGCGRIVLDGCLNVDRRDLPGVDIVADAGSIPIEAGSVQEIFSAHLLECVQQETLQRRLLPHLLSLLRPGGVFRAIVPDGAAMVAAVAVGSCPFGEFRDALFGAGDDEDDVRFNVFTPATLRALLEEAGFRDITVPASARRCGRGLEFEIMGVRP